MSRFRRYSLHNVMLIALQKPAATHVAGFHTWKNYAVTYAREKKGFSFWLRLCESAKQWTRNPPRRRTTSRYCISYDDGGLFAQRSSSV